MCGWSLLSGVTNVCGTSFIWTPPFMKRSFVFFKPNLALWQYQPPAHQVALSTSYAPLVISLPSTLQAHNGQFFYQSLQLHNLPVDWARELFKPSTDSVSLPFQTEKNLFFVSDLGFSISDVTMDACFSAFLAEVTWPFAPIQWAIFDSSFFGI